MPFINLIEEQRQILKRAEAKTRAAFLSFVGVTSLSVLGFGWLLYRTEAVSGDVAKLQADARKIEPLTKQIEADRKLLSEMSPKLKTLEDAQELTARWDRILEHLSQNTPGPMWLTDLRAVSNDPAKPVQTSFIGLCDRLEPVGEFILRLQTCPDLETVNLKFAAEKQVAQGKGIEFEVQASVAGTATEQPKKSDKKEGGAA